MKVGRIRIEVSGKKSRMTVSEIEGNLSRYHIVIADLNKLTESDAINPETKKVLYTVRNQHVAQATALEDAVRNTKVSVAVAS